jgi:hypothetical protein
MQTENRIQSAIHEMGTRLKGISTEKRKKLRDSLTLDAREHYGWQTCQARAHAEGVITVDEAMTLYRAIQNWDTQPMQTRIIVTQSIHELLKQQSERPERHAERTA